MKFQSLTAAMMVTLLSACSAHQKNSMPDISDTLAGLSLTEAANVSHAAPEQQWWNGYHDAVLNNLIESAFTNNAKLETALLKIEESQARWGVTKAKDAPELALGGEYRREALSADSPLAMLGAPTYAINRWQTGLSASWELDFFGYQEQLNSAALHNVATAGYTAEGVKVALAAEVAGQYFELLENLAQQDILHRQLNLLAIEADYLDSQIRNGAASPDMLATLDSARLLLERQLPDLAQVEHRLKNRLAYITGQPPGAMQTIGTANRFTADKITSLVPEFEGDIHIGITSDLVRHRPDILAAEAQLRSALASRLAAEADFYPRVSLHGDLGLMAFTFSDLGSWDSGTFSVGPTFHLPIFDGGRLEQTLALTDAREKQAAVHYRDTVLRALHEVDNALSGVSQALKKRQLSTQRKARLEALLAASESRLTQGTDSELDVVVARLSLLTTARQYIADAADYQLRVIGLQRAVARSEVINFSGEETVAEVH